MGKRLFMIFISFAFSLSLVSSSGGFGSDANKDESTATPNDQRPYTRENAQKPLGQGGYNGGHDTISAEGMMLKEQVHQQTDSDSGAAFRKEMVGGALPNLRKRAQTLCHVLSLFFENAA